MMSGDEIYISTHFYLKNFDTKTPATNMNCVKTKLFSYNIVLQ